MVHKNKVWVSFKEKYHGAWYDIWKNMTLSSAKKMEKNWNMFDNPEEHLAIVAVSKKKPSNLEKTKVRGMYRAVIDD